MNILAIAALLMMMQGGTPSRVAMPCGGPESVDRNGFDWTQPFCDLTLKPYPDWRLQGFAADGDWASTGALGELYIYIPTDVPAIQVPSTEPPNGPPPIMEPHGAYTKWCSYTGDSAMICSDEPPLVWTCQDTKRALLESVDGSLHVCHRIAP